MASPKRKKGLRFKEIGDKEKWVKGNKISTATPLERYDGVRGISFKIGSKVNYGSGVRFSKTLWIDEKLDVNSWLAWFIRTLKRLYYKLFRKEISIVNEEVEFYKVRFEKLTEELVKTKEKLRQLEFEKIENEKIKEFALKVKEEKIEFDKIKNKLFKIVKESYETKKGKEEDIKKIIKENPWLLGLECFVEAKNKNIDTQLQLDLHIKTKYNQDRVFELKSPNVKLFKRKKYNKKTRLNISPELAEGLSELILYLRRTDIYSNKKTEGTYGIQKPTGVILGGYNLSSSELELLKELNFHLHPHIQIITYNDLKENVERELKIIKSLKGKTND